MALTPAEEYGEAVRIVNAVCKAAEVSYFDFLSAPKSLKLNTARGVCCLIAWERGVHARKLAKLIHRTRSNVLNMTRKTFELYKIHDTLVVNMYNSVQQELNR